MQVIVLRRQRGKQPPPYGPRHCVLCYRKAYLSLDSFLYYCACGWSGRLPAAERADGVRYEQRSL